MSGTVHVVEHCVAKRVGHIYMYVLPIDDAEQVVDDNQFISGL